MSKENIIPFCFVFIFYVLFIFTWFRHQKYINQLLEDCNNYAKKLNKELQMKINLKEIINNSKRTKENYFETLEKIEKELFKQ